MAKIELQDVTVDIPVYNVRGRSLKSMVFQHAIGGNMRARDRGDVVVIRALDRVNATFSSGERIGLIGHNGAGKTTLLRVMSGVYAPTTGDARIEGEVSGLTDIMAGIDMEATGYDNIIYRSILLGHTNSQAKALVPEIEEFSELGEYLNLPVRTYSTGMMLRLTFAITTSIRPAILLMDEMISAGDASFIEKARARLQGVISNANIVVISSHVEGVIREFCNRVLWMEHGRVMMDGPPDEVLRAYHEAMDS
ncbi:MAG: ABC transporter ATP-binding protein [Rhizobiales bacterium]|nr:ABC transporter ATP-binding protein [Hyphomicrobiales bacterium]